MAFDVKAFFDPATSTVTYLVWDVATGEAAVMVLSVQRQLVSRRAQ